MSAVELAVEQVKKLSARQARELLDWLSEQQFNATARPRPSRPTPRKRKAKRSMRELKAWQDEVRFTTDWEPPRMPPDLVKPTIL